MEIRNIKTWAKNATPIICGSAKRTSNYGKKDANNNEYSISLADLSMPQILKLAEERAKSDDTFRRPPDNFSHKRIAVSENITRQKALRSDLNASKNLVLTSGSDQSDDNEDFFENLFKKMTAEQFIPLDQMDGSKKRTCLWNKENLNDLKKTKRRKENRANAVPIPPTMVSFKERLLSRQCDSVSSIIPMKTQKASSNNELALDLIQEDINMEESDSNSIDRGSSLIRKKSLNDSFRRNKIIENSSTPTSSCKTVELRRTYTTEKFYQEPGYRPVTTSCDYFTKPYLIVSNLPNHSYLPTIQECHEPSVIIPPQTHDAVYGEFDRHSNVSLEFTRPLSPELSDCNADNFGIERDNTISWDSFRTLSCSSGDLNCISSSVEKIV